MEKAAKIAVIEVSTQGLAGYQNVASESV